MNTEKLTGKTIVITGAGSGMGAAMAKDFAAREAKVAVFDLNETNGSKIAEEIKAAGGVANYYKVDVTKKEESAKSDFRFIIYLIIATVPAAIVGLLFEDYIAEKLKGITTIAIALLITGVALWSIRNLKGRKNDNDLSFKDAFLIGIAQAVALIPGISRSGATIVAAMALGTKQETALRFSFLLYIPVSLGGMLLSFTDIFNDPHLGSLALPYTLAFFGSLFMSYFSLRWFMNIMAKGNLIYFSIYCFIVGGFVLLFH